MLIFGIETSCDETACAVVKDGTEVVGAFLATSAETHLKTGGVVPEVAARKQVESIIPVIEECFKASSLSVKNLDALTVTVGPGLIGSLIVGVETAKALAAFYALPLVPVNHLVGHIYGNFVGRKPSEIEFPCVVLIVSGGHTDLVLMKGHGVFDYIGGTLDDACGEAFDKVARILGLAPYFGGPHVSKAASSFLGKASFRFKRPMSDSGNFNFSFSGIKTAVVNKVLAFRKENALDAAASLPPDFVSEVAFEFQEAVTDVLVLKTLKALKQYSVGTLLIAGGVAANATLRKKFEEASATESFKFFVPPLDLCSDNAIYIASCAEFNFKPSPLNTIFANPSLTVVS
ncbi:MAG: tRNA (adenosine(37)-N6)-threonylcarbamoyltransferase complex transferase subunit TsaD [Patescibacteria group bacterium]